MIRGIEFEAERGLTLDFRDTSLIDSQSVSSGGNFFVIETFFETEKVFANKTLIPGKVHKSSTAINWSKRVSRDQRVSLCWTWFLWPELRLTIFSQVYFYCFFFSVQEYLLEFSIPNVKLTASRRVARRRQEKGSRMESFRERFVAPLPTISIALNYSLVSKENYFQTFFSWHEIKTTK